MNFFDAQDQARRSTRRLVFVYVLSVVLIVVGVSLLVSAAAFLAHGAAYNGPGRSSLSGGSFLNYLNTAGTPIFIQTAVVTALFIGGATLVKTLQMKAGGGRVALQMGGTLVSPETRDPLRQRLRNVVEEMAIASGVPVPEIYVLEQETGINAFAAGFAPGDAAIAVTRGTLETLNRDELQGVIGHEFSHVLNGDMRLNIRLIGVIFGLLGLGLIGRTILRGVFRAGDSARGCNPFKSDSKGGGAIVVAIIVVAFGLVILGSVGVFFGRLIKAGVSRQREFLADASAVQFTRQTDGLAGALRKIGGYSAGSLFENSDPEEVSHMLFGTGSRLSSMFATHPPLAERILALDPSFREGDYPTVQLGEQIAAVAADTDDRYSGLAEGAGMAGAGEASDVGLSTSSVIDSVGQPTVEHVAAATHVRRTVPLVLYDAAHSTESSYLLVVALILDRSGRVLDRQFSVVNERLGEQRATLVRRYYDELRRTGVEYRLPLLEIAFPALRQRTPGELDYLVDLTGHLIEIDGEIELHEFCFHRVLAANLRHAMNPSKGPRQVRASRKSVRAAAVSLLRIIARHGHDSDADASEAFRVGLTKFGKWGEAYNYAGETVPTTADLEKSLDRLVALKGKGRRTLLNSVISVVMHDDLLTVPEAELVRVVCASLEIPLPPQIGVSLNS